MMSRPARYSAALAGSSGCAARSPGVPVTGTAVSVMGLLVRHDRADPVADAGIAPDQPEGVEDGHRDEAQRDPREPVVRLGLAGLEQVVDGDGDRRYTE